MPTVALKSSLGSSIIRSLLFAVIVLGCAIQALAWNSLGHKTIAEIAWRQLDPTTRQSIVDTLRRHPRFDIDFVAKMEDGAAQGDKAIQDHWIFQHASTWPDQIRKNKEYDKPAWHYINLPLFLDPSDQMALAGKLPVNLSTEYPTALPLDQYNVLQAIAYCRAILRSKAGADVKAIAYCWLFHLVGDIHQPLHSTALFSVSQFPKGDRGGNSIPLVHGKNLHSLWDNLLGRAYYMRNVSKAVAQLSDRQRFGDVWDTAAKETDPRKWADESHELCRSFVYSDTILAAVTIAPEGAKLAPIDLPESYMKEAGESARRRIVAAGLRLGKLLSDNTK